MVSSHCQPTGPATRLPAHPARCPAPGPAGSDTRPAHQGKTGTSLWPNRRHAGTAATHLCVCFAPSSSTAGPGWHTKPTSLPAWSCRSWRGPRSWPPAAGAPAGCRPSRRQAGAALQQQVRGRVVRGCEAGPGLARGVSAAAMAIPRHLLPWPVTVGFQANRADWPKPLSAAPGTAQGWAAHPSGATAA